MTSYDPRLEGVHNQLDALHAILTDDSVHIGTNPDAKPVPDYLYSDLEASMHEIRRTFHQFVEQEELEYQLSSASTLEYLSFAVNDLANHDRERAAEMVLQAGQQIEAMGHNLKHIDGKQAGAAFGALLADVELKSVDDIGMAVDDALSPAPGAKPQGAAYEGPTH